MLSRRAVTSAGPAFAPWTVKRMRSRSARENSRPGAGVGDGSALTFRSSSALLVRMTWGELIHSPVRAGSGTSIHEILAAAGLKNAAAEAGIKGHIKLAPEQITEINPDVILIASGYERDRGFRQALENDAQLSAVRAVKEKRIVEAQARGVLTVSHHVADAVDALVEAVNHLQKTKGGGRDCARIDQPAF